MRRGRTIGRAALAALVLATVLIGAGAPGASGQPGAGGGDAGYWNGARRAAAEPRDLVVDDRGLAYQRRADGALVPHGHDTPAAYPRLRAVPAAGAPQPNAKPGGGGGGADTTPPQIGVRDPLAGATIGTSHTFSAVVTDNVAVKAVSFVIVYPNGVQTSSFAAALTNPSTSTWSLAVSGFSAGTWQWYVVATDTAKPANKATSSTTPFTVSTGGGGGGGGGGGSDVVTNAPWTGDGTVQTAAGRIYFEMPANRKATRWNGYVCSGTTIVDGVGGRSVILTAAHCIYDDVNKRFARNVIFIPDQAATTGAGTDRDCTNDPHGCWSPSFGIVDVDWTTRTFPNNVAWDYGYYVVNDEGAHDGAGSEPVLDALPFGAQPLTPFTAGDTSAVATALGYSYSEDPGFMHCAETLGQESAVNWWLPSCGLSGGSSGGPWLQPTDAGDGPIISLNSWGYTTSPGMAGPKLAGSSAECLLGFATTENLTGGDLSRC